jgi:hypothetical protein
MQNLGTATIVGAADGLELSQLTGLQNIFALNSAYFHLVGKNIQPCALITGDQRYIASLGSEKKSTVNRIITFTDTARWTGQNLNLEDANIERYRCLGRDGFSTDIKKGFYHGCSSFFFAVQYLVAIGHQKIRTVGVNFPPPEMYSRINGTSGHPEFVYDVQLRNLAALKDFIRETNTTIECTDKNSNLNIFL